MVWDSANLDHHKHNSAVLDRNGHPHKEARHPHEGDRTDSHDTGDKEHAAQAEAYGDMVHQSRSHVLGVFGCGVKKDPEGHLDLGAGKDDKPSELLTAERRTSPHEKHDEKPHAANSKDEHKEQGLRSRKDEPAEIGSNVRERGMVGASRDDIKGHVSEALAFASAIPTSGAGMSKSDIAFYKGLAQHARAAVGGIDASHVPGHISGQVHSFLASLHGKVAHTGETIGGLYKGSKEHDTLV